MSDIYLRTGMTQDKRSDKTKNSEEDFVQWLAEKCRLGSEPEEGWGIVIINLGTGTWDTVYEEKIY